MSSWVLMAALANAQAPDVRWQTAETEHFRVHYPVTAEAWGLEVASTIEEIRLRVNEEVGWVPSQTMDILVVDPYGQANGSAWPFAQHPRMLLWATPPGPGSGIGHYRSWGELLVTHEYAHMVHLLRSSRSPFGRALERTFGLAPITRKAPRWCTEGYATVIEARLSGFGRPHTDARALLLRRLAQAGKFPTFGELNAFDRYAGGSFAYLVGSSYLEWLEARAGEGTLRDLWARMTAREDRSFEDAFSGVFGDSPERLYARFTAEVTADAMAIEAVRPVDEGTLWNDLTWYTGAPAVSPDGTAIAAMTTSREKPSVLRIWSLEEDDTDKEEKRQERLEELLEDDPDDVLPVDPKHPPRKQLHQRTFVTRSASEPRFMPDGDALLFTSWQPRLDGRIGPDLFLWEPESGKERRVSVDADLRSADPFPDGERALAVRQDWGRTHLVIVDIEDGSYEPLTEPALDVIFDQPRVAPVGDRVAWLEHRGGGWAIVVHDREDGARWTIGGQPGGVIPTGLAWSPDGESLYASVGSAGFVEIHEVWGVNGARGQLTRTRGGAMAPAATADALFYLSMDYDGAEIHRLALEDVGSDVAVESRSPVVRPEWQPGPEPPGARDVEADRYGLGRSEWRPILGGSWSRAQAAIEGGVRLGDIVGKRDLLLMGSYGRNSGVTGGLLASTWRVLPFDVSVQGFMASEPPELMRRYGALLKLDNGYRWSATRLSWELAGSYDRPLSGTREEDEGAVVTVPGERMVSTLGLGVDWVEPRAASVRAGLVFRGQAGATDAQPWYRSETGAAVTLGRQTGLTGSYTLGLGNATTSLDRYRLGGTHSSVLPEVWQLARIDASIFDLGVARGAHRDEVRVELGQPGLAGLVAERHRMSDDLAALGRHGHTAISVQGSVSTDAVPFQRIPDGTFDAGLGCRLEDRLNGWAEAPCQTVDDWALWFRVGWGL